MSDFCKVQPGDVIEVELESKPRYASSSGGGKMSMGSQKGYGDSSV